MIIKPSAFVTVASGSGLVKEMIAMFALATGARCRQDLHSTVYMVCRDTYWSDGKTTRWRHTKIKKRSQESRVHCW